MLTEAAQEKSAVQQLLRYRPATTRTYHRQAQCPASSTWNRAAAISPPSGPMFKTRRSADCISLRAGSAATASSSHIHQPFAIVVDNSKTAAQTDAHV